MDRLANALTRGRPSWGAFCGADSKKKLRSCKESDMLLLQTEQGAAEKESESETVGVSCGKVLGIAALVLGLLALVRVCSGQHVTKVQNIFILRMNGASEVAASEEDVDNYATDMASNDMFSYSSSSHTDSPIPLSASELDSEASAMFDDNVTGDSIEDVSNFVPQTPADRWLSDKAKLCLMNRANLNQPESTTRKNLLTLTAGVQHAFLVEKLIPQFPMESFDIIIFHWDMKPVAEDIAKWAQAALPKTPNATQVGWWNQSNVKHIFEKGTKLDFARKFLTPEHVCEYEYILLWDADVRLAQRKAKFDAVEYLDAMRENKVDVAMPSLYRSDATWPFTHHKHPDSSAAVRDHWFVEVGFVTFNTNTWLRARAILSRWHFQLYFFDTLPYRSLLGARRVAVMNDFAVIHKNKRKGGGKTLKLNHKQINREEKWFKRIIKTAEKHPVPKSALVPVIMTPCEEMTQAVALSESRIELMLMRRLLKNGFCKYPHKLKELDEKIRQEKIKKKAGKSRRSRHSGKAQVKLVK